MKEGRRERRRHRQTVADESARNKDERSKTTVRKGDNEGEGV